jgi:hypothetical protein
MLIHLAIILIFTVFAVGWTLAWAITHPRSSSVIHAAFVLIGLAITYALFVTLDLQQFA